MLAGGAISFTAPERARENVRLVVRAVSQQEPSNDAKGLRQQYLAALAAMQRHPYLARTAESGWFLNFGPFDSRTGATLEALLEIARIEPEDVFESNARETVEREIAAARELLLLLRPHELETADLLIGTLVFVRKAGSAGGSFGTALGMVWLNPQHDWTTADYAEALLHETVHQALFLEQLVRGMFTVDDGHRLAEEDARVVSAILRIGRPYDASLHSAWVAIALAEFDLERGEVDEACAKLSSLRPTVDGLREKDRFLDDHGKLLLSELESRYDAAVREISIHVTG